MKPLLWTVLAVSGLVNGTSTLTTDGAAQVVVSVVTGVVALAAATGLVLLRGGRNRVPAATTL